MGAGTCAAGLSQSTLFVSIRRLKVTLRDLYLLHYYSLRLGGEILDRLISLSKNKDFQRLYKKGKSFVSPVLVVYVLRNHKQTVRIGITTSKKIGNAVLRNRSRRVIREAFMSISERVQPGFDLVFVARGKTPYIKSTGLADNMLKQLRMAGLIIH